MIPLPIPALVAVLLGVPASSAAPAASLTAPASLPTVLQEGDEPADKRPEVAEKIEVLEAHAKARGEEDAQAISALEALTAEFAASGPRDRKAIVDAVEDCLTVRRKELQDGVPDDKLQRAAATALGSMGPESVKPLTKAIGHKSLRDNLALQVELVQSLGKTKDPDAVKPLSSLLKHKDAEMQAAGAQALGQFREVELKERKKIFEDLLKTMMTQKGEVDADNTDPEANRRYSIIVPPIIGSLQLLSGQNISDPVEWQRWWNKNKKEDWDTPQDA